MSRVKLRNDGTIDRAGIDDEAILRDSDASLNDTDDLVSLKTPESHQGEIIRLRTQNSKTYNLGGRRRRTMMFVNPVHFRDGDGNLKNLSTRWRDTGTHFVVDRVGYTLSVDKSRGVGYRFDVGDEHTTRNLLRIGSIRAKDFLNTVPVMRKNRLYWRNVVDGVDIYLEARPEGGEFYKVIRTKRAPRQFRWRISRPTSMSKIAAAPWHTAQDSMFRDHPGRDVRREIEVFSARSNETTTEGRHRFDEVEGLNSRSAVRGKISRRLIWEDGESDWQYPLLFDQPDVDVSVSATADDGVVYDDGSQSWDQDNGTGLMRVGYADGGSYKYHPGFRFLNVIVDQAASVTAATLEVEVRHNFNGTPTFDVYGGDYDDAAAWGDTGNNLPTNQTNTTATVAWAPTAGDTRYNIDVQTIVQEIVDRGSWASGNAMRFGLVVSNSGAGSHDFLMKDVSTSGYGDPAALTITWDAAAGGSSDLERGVQRGVQRGVMRGVA